MTFICYFRHHLACWLEQEIGVIRQLCNLNTSSNTDQEDVIDRSLTILHSLSLSLEKRISLF